MKLKKVIGSLCVVAVLSGCAQQQASNTTFTGEEAEQPEYQDNLNAISPQAYSSIDDLELEPGTYISVIGKDTDSAYWKALIQGVEQAAQDLNERLGYSGSDKIKVVYSAPQDMDNMDEQVNILDEELARYPDAIAIASIDADEGVTQFDQAYENGIPIIAFDSGNNYKGIICTCKTDNVEAAKTGASKISDEIGDSGKVLLLVHDSFSGSARERVSGFQEEIGSREGVEIADTLYYDRMEEMKKVIASEMNEGREETEEEISAESITDTEVLSYYLEKNPDVTGIFGTNVTVTQWALETLRESGKSDDDMVLMGFDAGAEQLEALESGEIDGLVVQNPFGMGYATVVAAARTILELGNEAEVDTGYIWVTQDNMDSESIQHMLYE